MALTKKWLNSKVLIVIFAALVTPPVVAQTKDQLAAELESTKLQMAGVKRELSKTKDELSKANEELKKTQEELASTKDQLSKAKEEIAALEPYAKKARQMPVSIGRRTASLGTGYVLQIRNTSGKPLSVKLSLSNPTFGKSKEYDLTIDPGMVKEIGHLEGWKGAEGDQIKLESAGYDSIAKNF
jgi:septal ring factor EnvC (AmiA/AmiB activator)